MDRTGFDEKRFNSYYTGRIEGSFHPEYRSCSSGRDEGADMVILYFYRTIHFHALYFKSKILMMRNSLIRRLLKGKFVLNYPRNISIFGFGNSVNENSTGIPHDSSEFLYWFSTDSLLSLPFPQYYQPPKSIFRWNSCKNAKQMAGYLPLIIQFSRQFQQKQKLKRFL